MVDVKGKMVETEWVEATATNGDETVVEKVWTAQDVPGGIVKQTITKKKAGKVASQSALELVTVAASQRPVHAQPLVVVLPSRSAWRDRGSPLPIRR